MNKSKFWGVASAINAMGASLAFAFSNDRGLVYLLLGMGVITAIWELEAKE